ncbi:MAG: hypothetical protein OZSIB_1359 [Candidatus Ozemobacter sibiricus]|jgi:hypothetical protein|uniref:OB-fold nucleic acid binding domain protein n=1 Tax=Candidatus Ozemobacter sibiricus TaxID=2268124 RepID=A0A367ZKZ0_9BACT|nr:MAG: hypothetical protein OZSIB_1359 [Candidatus Ozemobacter sibiricus]
MKPRVLALAVLVALWCIVPAEGSANPTAGIFTPLADIVANPSAFVGKLVSVQATFQGWRNAPGSPPVTRSDWVIQAPGGPSIYCTGQYPEDLRPEDPAALGRPVTVLGQVMLATNGQPYLQVSQVTPMHPTIERMVSVSQILFDPLGMQGRTVGLLGVLAKGYGPRGNRLYLLADPTGAITLERLPKLYPKGTILRLRGVVGTDSNGLPVVKNVEILSAQP